MIAVRDPDDFRDTFWCHETILGVPDAPIPVNLDVLEMLTQQLASKVLNSFLKFIANNGESFEFDYQIWNIWIDFSLDTDRTN